MATDSRPGFWHSFTALGLIIGTLFFAASLTPSLVPRHPVVQGVLSGLCLGAGYGIGVALRALWLFLQLPVPQPSRLRAAQIAAMIACGALAALALWKASEWQNTLRALMGMDPVDGARPLVVAAIALVLFAILLLIGRLFRVILFRLSDSLSRRVPGPVAVIIALVVTALIFWQVGNGVVVRQAFKVFDASYARFDALIEDGSPQPTDPLKTGGPGSLLTWEGLGPRRARDDRARSRPREDRGDDRRHGDGTAARLCRPQLGGNGGRARPACARRVDPHRRVRAHDTLVIVTPTGTGWVDPESQMALEYLLRGDVASRLGAVFLSGKLARPAGRPGIWRGYRAGRLRQGLRSLAQPAARRPSETLCPRPEPRFVQLGPQPRSLPGDRRSLSRCLLGRSPLPQPDMDIGDTPAQRGQSVLAVRRSATAR